MRLLVLGTKFEELPELPDEFTQILIEHPSPDDLLHWALEADAPVVLVAKSAGEMSDEVLESVSQVVEVDDPRGYMAEVAEEDDLVFMAWDNSETAYDNLRTLTKKDVHVLDMNDGFRELVIDQTPDYDDLVANLTARITANVLKTLRAEMQELSRNRRYRSGSPKV